MVESSCPRQCRIEWRLVPLKVLYFAFYAGSGCLLPFISVYMKQIGLTSIETGIIFGFMPFVIFFASPLFGMVADKTRQHKLVLITSAILSGLFYNCLLLVPARSVNNAEDWSVKATLRCGKGPLYVYNYFGSSDAANRSHILSYSRCYEGLETLIDNNKSLRGQCQFKCTANRRHIDTGCVEGFNVTSTFEDKNDSLNVLKDSKTLDFIVNVSDIMALDSDGTHRNTCQSYYLKEFNFDSMAYSSLHCDNVTHYDCDIDCGNQNNLFLKSFVSERQTTCEQEKDSNPTTFYLYFVFFFFGTLFNVPLVSLVDGIAYSMLGEERRADWGKQRMWGAISFLFIAPISTYIMDRLGTSKTEANYQVSFHLFLGFNILVAVIAYFMQFSKETKSGKFLENVTKLFRYPEIVVFLFLNIFFGIFKVVLEVFLFWHLKTLNSPQVVFGLAVMANCIPEALMLGQTGRIIKKVGCVSCLYISLIAFAIRFFAYSLLTNPWYVLMIEPLNAFTFALMYAAATAYASEIAPTGMSTTMLGIRGGFHSGLGKGIGGLMSGKLFDKTGLGGVLTFRLYSLASLVVLVVYATLQLTCFRKDKKTREKDEVIQMSKDHVYSKLLNEDMSDSDSFEEEETSRTQQQTSEF